MSAPMHFRVYPEGRKKRLYFEVHIFRSKARMFRFYRATGQRYKCNFLAIVQSWEAIDYSKSQRGKKTPSLGQILFSPRALRVGIISHEMTHAGMTWAYRRGVRVLTHQGEERLCQAVENMTAQFWRLYLKRRKVK